MRFVLAFLLLTAMGVQTVAAREPARVSDPKDRQIVQNFLQHVERVPAQLTAEKCKKQAADQPEGYVWMLSPYLGMPLTAYEVTGDPKYLDMFAKCFDNMRTALTKGPDGFLGWYGKALGTFQNPDKPDQPVDVIITSFRITELVCRFLELVAEEPALSAKYAQKRAQYLDLLENHLVKKWNVRGNYVDLGTGGAIYRTNKNLKFDKAHLTQPHNKHSIIIRGLLALYRVTGKDEYARKAVKLGTRYKRSLKLKDGHYEWHYWDPAGAWDVNPREPGRWKHWIGVEHKGGYYCSSLTQAVVLYQHGLVFDATDMQRFTKTQLEMCWNGDMANPKWARVDGTTSDRYMQGSYMCASLAPFSPRLAEFIYTGPRQAERLENASHSWQGGPVASGWISGKLVDLPGRQGGRQVYAGAAQRFLSSPANQAFYKELAFEVTEPGYKAPEVPAQMKPMPTAPE